MILRPKRGATPWGLIGMLALVAAGERYVAKYQHAEFTTAWASGWRQTGLQAREAAGCDLLLMGDSLVKFGVPPRVVEHHLGARTTNLAMAVAQPPTTFAVLRRALRAGARPRAIVVDFTEHLLSSGPRKNVRHWPELLSVAECLDLAWTARDAGLLAELWVAKLLPSVKVRYEIREGVRSALAAVMPTERAKLPSFWRNWRVNGGAQLHPWLPPMATADVWFRIVYPQHWDCHPVNAEYIDRFLSLAGARGIPVFWLLPPYQAECQALCERNGVDGRFERFVREAQARHPYLTIIDGRHATYPASAYAADPIHLNIAGAAVFADDVADLVGRHLAGESGRSRWLTLPDYRERTIAVQLEHLTQSAEALRR